MELISVFKRLLYDLSSAFDTVCHEVLFKKLQSYGFDDHSISWMKSYLADRKQMVSMSGNLSTTQEIKVGVPQGSRLSPLLFICLMADLDLCVEKSMLSNFADDTQSIIVSDKKEVTLEITMREANNVLIFFANNNLVNNVDKAAVLYNSKGKGKDITVENIGGKEIKSTYSEKLLGFHVNSDFNWNTHVDMISIELKKRLGLLKRIKNKIPKNKLIMVAEAIFNSKIRYGISVYLNPIYESEDLKMQKTTKNATTLQTLQNTMIRTVLGFSKKKHVNMAHVRKELKMMSINQMCVYHTLIEAYNVIRNSSSEEIKMKWSKKHESKYSLRSEMKSFQIIPEKPMARCTGFSYHGSKLYNKLPSNIKDTTNTNTFKSLIKTWIWDNIPAY